MDFLDHSQIELEAVESYERSHRGREAVLNKLRYLRGREPFAGYDAMSVDEILAALEEADLATIKRVRGYNGNSRIVPASWTRSPAFTESVGQRNPRAPPPHTSRRATSRRARGARVPWG